MLFLVSRSGSGSAPLLLADFRFLSILRGKSGQIVNMADPYRDIFLHRATLRVQARCRFTALALALRRTKSSPSSFDVGAPAFFDPASFWTFLAPTEFLLKGVSFRLFSEPKSGKKNRNFP